MRVLIVKTSSMGDVVHTLPAVTDAARAMPEIEFDWLVEEAFAEIPGWHPAVKNVIPVALRRWRKRLFARATRLELRALKQRLQAERYDLIIDAQGLLKSAWLSRKAQGVRCGFDKASAREPLASLSYQRRFGVAKGQHAIARVRQLFAQALGYEFVESVPDYGLSLKHLPAVESNQPYVVFLHGTTWPSKHWPESHWIELAHQLAEGGLQVHLPWGSEIEQQRAERIAAASDNAMVLPPLSLKEVAAQLAYAQAVVGVDTGLSHLAAALAVPTLALYGATDPTLTGVTGARQQSLMADFDCVSCLKRQCDYVNKNRAEPSCLEAINAQQVFDKLTMLMQGKASHQEDVE